ncbi:inactive dipeptidyl peptidase 10-like [Uloborus diversus]|uniref:inactive dipeptidyl peptidase 10-like n=1 Tax=Uloborus diversus TaxID=327109 RepID=UPI00240A69ED|nr:inactive dipeptidyl peptidase 10-like [Uloborus diversus]
MTITKCEICDREPPGDQTTSLGRRGHRINLADVLSDDFKPRLFNGTWVSDDILAFRDRAGHLVFYSIRMKSSKVIVHNSIFKENRVVKYSIAADQKYILLIYDVIQVYKYSFDAKYKIYDIENRKIHHFWPLNKPGEKLQFVTWGNKGNQMAYVYKNNVYYLPTVNGTHYLVSSEGVEGIVFNGVPDWLYEEEILKSNSALWFSPDGSSLCFATFNDSKVGSYYYNWYGNHNDSNNVLAQLRSLRYPKAGHENPTAVLWVVDLRSPSRMLQRDVKPPREVQDQLVHVWDYYFTSVQWVDSESLAVTWMARSQNYSVVTQCRALLWYCSVVYEHRPPSRRGWVDLYDPVTFGHAGKTWFLRLPLSEGNYGHYRHIAAANNNSRHIDFLTMGRFEVTKIVAYHEGSNNIYFLATKENRPGEQHLYSVPAKKSSFAPSIKCLTCDEEFLCLFNNVIFSPGAEYFVLECLGPGVPKVEIKSIYNQSFGLLDSNSHLVELMEKRTMPQIRTFQVPIKGGYKAQVRLFLPPDITESEMYPLVVYSDGAPGSQLVTQEFSIHWGTYLSGRRNQLYASIDGRGSANQGDKMLHEIYYHLGTAEIEDQIEVIRYLKDNLPFVHPTNIAIWGRAYGGYVATSALAADNTVFKCAVAISPITSWIYYDTTYTERYMGMPLPQDNCRGYEQASLMRKAHKFKGKKLLLLHGTADATVHIQHSTMFMKALTEEGVLFQTQIYTDENHSLKNVKRHMYRTMEDFLTKCFSSEKEDFDGT